MFHYLAFYAETVDGKVLSTKTIPMTWETKIRSVKDFEQFEKAVREAVGKEVEVTVFSPLLLDC